MTRLQLILIVELSKKCTCNHISLLQRVQMKLAQLAGSPRMTCDDQSLIMSESCSKQPVNGRHFWRRARHCFKYFTCINPSNPPNNPMRLAPLSPLSLGGNRHREVNLSQPEGGVAKTETQVVWSQHLCSQQLVTPPLRTILCVCVCVWW